MEQSPTSRGLGEGQISSLTLNNMKPTYIRNKNYMSLVLPLPLSGGEIVPWVREALSAQPAAAWVPVAAVHRQDCGGNPAWRGWIKLITLIMPPGDLKAACNSTFNAAEANKYIQKRLQKEEKIWNKPVQPYVTYHS